VLYTWIVSVYLEGGGYGGLRARKGEKGRLE